MENLNAKKEKLYELLKSGSKPAVAFSGGIDSTLLLYLCCKLRQGDALGIMAVTPGQSREEVEYAESIIREYDLNGEFLQLDILTIEAVAHNHRDRCYHCKTKILTAIEEKAKAQGCGVIYDGSNADDAGEYRPGAKALKEKGVLSPLQLCGFTKTNVRELAEELNLKNWNKPSVPCLLTRFPYDLAEPIDRNSLRVIAAGERILKEYCRENFRLRREQDGSCRIEAATEDMMRILVDREGIIGALAGLGLKKVCLDLRPFRSGSFDREVRK
ncbi:MAG: ATP-dependent sacrificial sulfur transferase LarE [Bacillota bacterium]|nr:ATP-dependent sacrificial sulfur transferase LarE [Bacillota bacterium]